MLWIEITKVAQASLRAKIAGVGIRLLGSLLLGPTTAMAEYDVKSALQLYDSADSDNRKVWEHIFGNTINGMRWANSVLVHRKQQLLFCEPNNVALTGPQVAEMLRSQLNADQSLGHTVWVRHSCRTSNQVSPAPAPDLSGDAVSQADISAGR
jgi:hypothetical protein